jgi:NarL family two-component system response regulator LiaR
MRGPHRVVVVDDTSEVRSALKRVLDETPDFEFAGAAASGEEALDLVTNTLPDLILMDIEMPDGSGLGAARAICDMLPNTKVIAWTNQEDPSSITEMIAAGAVGYLLKSASDRELIEHRDGRPMGSRCSRAA